MKRKIWVGVGAYMLTSVSPAVTAAAQDDSSAMKIPGAFQYMDKTEQSTHVLGQALQLAAAGGEGGEGGESGEGGEGGEAGLASTASPEQTFVTQLLLMQGHLRVGKALVDQGNWDDALAHFKHPVEEIYSAIEDELTAREITQFEGQLNTLADQVQNKAGGEAFEQNYADVMVQIGNAVNSVDTNTRTSPDFVLDVALQLLRQASEEYEAAVADDKLVNVAEYQDSLGFVWVAEDLVQGVSDQLQAADGDAYEQLQNRFAELKTAWPSVAPPLRPAATPSQVYGTVARIEIAMNDLKQPDN